MFMCVFAHDFISERLMISEMPQVRWRLEIFLKEKREKKRKERERRRERGALAAVTEAEDAFQQERQVVWDDVHEKSRHVWHGVVVAEHVVLDAVGGFRGL